MLELIMGVIGTLLYPLFSVLFVAVDGLQDIFQAFAGIGTMTLNNGTTIKATNDGELNSTGILYYFFQSDIIRNLFISILVLALFLIVIFTAMAFIKNVYQPKPKSWQDIIGSAIKGLVNFIFLPVCCLLGVWLGNILLKAIDGATSTSTSSTMSSKLFVASAYNANRYRVEGMFDDGATARKIYSIAGLGDLDAPETDVNAVEYYADAVDAAFSSDSDGIHQMVYFSVHTFSVGDTQSLGAYYNLAKINYLVLIAGGGFMLYVLGSLAFGMVKRLFILLTLFVVSPAVCALYPLDDGGAVKSWKGSFIKETLSAYAAVAGMNLFFSIIPLVNQISVVGDASSATVGFMNGLLSLFITIAGLFMVKELISLVNGFVGGNDAFSAGSGLMKNTLSEPKKRLSKTSEFVKKRTAEASRFSTIARSAGVKSATFDLLKNTTKNTTGIDVGAFKDGIKSGKDEGYKFLDDRSSAEKARGKVEKENERLDKLYHNTGNNFSKSIKRKTSNSIDERAYFNTINYDKKDEETTLKELDKIKDPVKQKEIAYQIAARSKGEISGEELASKAKNYGRVHGADSVAAPVIQANYSSIAANTTADSIQTQMTKIEGDLSSLGASLGSALGTSLYGREITAAEKASLNPTQQKDAEAYNKAFRQYESLGNAMDKAKENVSEATFQLRTAMADLAAKFKVSINDIVDTFGDNLENLDKPLKTVSGDMKKLQEALQKAQKAGEKESK